MGRSTGALIALIVVQPPPPPVLNVNLRCEGSRVHGSDAPHGSRMLASAAGTALVHEITQMRLCAMPGGGMLDFWTESPPNFLPRCLPWVTTCPDGSERETSSMGDRQCVAPDTFPAQLSVRFRQIVNCIPGVAICQVPSWLDGVWLWNSPELAAAALKLAQCLRIARQEVQAGVMVWTGNTRLHSFYIRREGEVWRRRLRSDSTKPLSAGAWSQRPLMDGRRLEGMRNVQLAWRIDSYRLSPSAATLQAHHRILHDLLYGSGALLASCMGIPEPFLPFEVQEQLVRVSDLEWKTSSSGPRLVQDPASFNVSYTFEGVAQDQLPPIVIKSDGEQPTPSPAGGLPAPGPQPNIAPVVTPTPTPAPFNVFSPRTAPEEEGSIDGRPLLYAAVAVGVALALLGLVMAVCFFRHWTPRAELPHERTSTGKTTSTKVPPSVKRAQTWHNSNPAAKKQAWGPNATNSGPPPSQSKKSPGAAPQTGPIPKPRQKLPRANSAGPSTFADNVLPVCPRIVVDKSEPFLQQKELLAAELEASLATEKLECRRRKFKDLCLRHHPDKNRDSDESKSLFQFLQAQRGTYLGD